MKKMLKKCFKQKQKVIELRKHDIITKTFQIKIKAEKYKLIFFFKETKANKYE